MVHMPTIQLLLQVLQAALWGAVPTVRLIMLLMCSSEQQHLRLLSCKIAMHWSM